MDEKEVVEVPTGISGFLAGAPPLIWIVLIVGGILAVQQFVPAEYEMWGNLAVVALVLIAGYIGISKQTIYTIVGLVGGGQMPEVPDGVAAAPAPQATVRKADQRRLRRLLW